MEVLVSLALLGLAIGLLAQLANEYYRVLRFTRSQDRKLVCAETLQRIASEVSGANLLSPNSLEVNLDHLSFELLALDSPTRFQSWTFGATPHREKIDYRVVNGDLIRSAGPTTTQTVARDIAGFSASRPSVSYVQLRISLEQRSNVVTLQTGAHLWIK